jgi:predicted metalloprotease with PDZ domain
MRTGITRLLFSLFLLFSLHGKGQNPMPEYSYHVTIDLMNVTPDKDRVKVTVTPPPVKGRVFRYVLPEYLPGVPGKVDAGRFIHQFYALDDKGFPLKVKKKGENSIVIKLKAGSYIKKIEYWIDDTWDDEKQKASLSDEKFNYVPQPAGTNIEAGTNYVLNHAFVFGYLDGMANLPYTIHVLKPAELEASSALRITSLSRSRDEYQAANYSLLVESPVMYSAPDTAGFNSGKMHITISVFSENGRVSAPFVRRIIATQASAYTNFMALDKPMNYKLIFYFTTPFKTVRNSHGAYGGLAHRGSTFYFMPELADEGALINEIRRETSGDLLHLLSPLDNRATCAATDNFMVPQLGKSWWFAQGASSYFTWLAAVRDSLVNESEFMGVVGAKIKLSYAISHKPLTDLPSVLTNMKQPFTREAIRARAMLTAFLLDIRLTESTGGKTGLREAVLEMNSYPRFSADSIESYLVRMAGETIHEFFRDYVYGTKPLPLIESLGKISWAYAPEAIDSVLTFGQFGLTYDGEKDVFFVHNADTLNRFGLRDGDRLVSVDNMILCASNFDEALQAIYSPKRDEEVEVHFIRGTTNLSVTAYPDSVAILVEHLVRFDPAATDAALLLHDRIFVNAR